MSDVGSWPKVDPPPSSVHRCLPPGWSKGGRTEPIGSQSCTGISTITPIDILFYNQPTNMSQEFRYIMYIYIYIDIHLAS